MKTTPILIVEIGDRQIFDHKKDELRYEYSAVLKFTSNPPMLPSDRSKTAKWMGTLTSSFNDPAVVTETQKAVYLLRQIATMIEDGVYQTGDKSYTGTLLDVMGHELNRAQEGN